MVKKHRIFTLQYNNPGRFLQIKQNVKCSFILLAGLLLYSIIILLPPEESVHTTPQQKKKDHWKCTGVLLLIVMNCLL